jgi:lipopolysaccharide export system protein LptA
VRVRYDWIALALTVLTAGTIARAAEEAPAGGRPTDQTDIFQSLSLGSRKEPIQINSDSLELDYKGSTLTYRGNVQVTQGDVTLTSDQLSISYDREAARRSGKAAAAAVPDQGGAATGVLPGRGDADKIKEVVAEGNVRIRKGTRLAEGRRAVFDQAKQTIVLSDGAVLHEGPNQVAGERIVVYLQEERSVVESGANSRVKAVFYPGSEDHTAAGTPRP